MNSPIALYLIEILHQTTTPPWARTCPLRCILSKFYIKPQRRGWLTLWIGVVSYRNSTSNHNLSAIITAIHRLYLIEILHQTTTFDFRPRFSPSCILSKFYIKPQRRACSFTTSVVVSYRNSTSNHNSFEITMVTRSVVSYRNSTSNHNNASVSRRASYVVSYRNSTSNHNTGPTDQFSGRVVSYRNSTSNHNRPDYLNYEGPVVSYRNSTSNHNEGYEEVKEI